MSITLTFTKITNELCEKNKNVLKTMCTFTQKQDNNKKLSGYYFDIDTVTERVIGIVQDTDPNIYTVVFMEERIDEKHVKLVAKMPYYVGREYMRQEHNRRQAKIKADNPKHESRDLPLPRFDNEPNDRICGFKGNLRDYQMQDFPRIIESMEKTGTCYFKADPGYGKTVAMCYILSHFKVPGIVLTSSVKLAAQCAIELRARLPNAKICLYEKGKIPTDDIDIVVSFAPRIDGKGSLFKRFELLVLDEIHLLSSKCALAGILSLSPKRILGLTATPGERNKISEMLIGPRPFESIYVKTWNICFPKIVTSLDGSRFEGQKGYINAITELSESKDYLEKIITFVQYFNSINERIFLITMRVALREKLADIIKEQLGIKTSVLTSEDGDQLCDNADIFIGTHKMIGTGFDLSKYVKDFDGKQAGIMIFCGSIKNETLMHQISGRSFRGEFSLAIFLVAEGIKIFENHAAKMRSHAEKIKGCIIKDEYGEFLEKLKL